MSIVTTAAAVPSRLLTLFATLADSENGEPRERLEAWATPPSLANRGGNDDGEASSALLTTTLQEARRLGLVVEEEGRLRVGTEVPRKRKGGDREAEFRAYMRDLLFSKERAAQAGQSGFMLALGWFLSRDPREPLSFGQPPHDALRADIGDLADSTELTNLNRYQSFLYWARYLGFAAWVGDGSVRRVIPDPSRAIEEAIPRLFASEEVYEIEPFMGELCTMFPVLEDGEARATIESARKIPSSDANNLSVSTSLALVRLAERGTIVIESIADARARILNFGNETSRVSKVRRGKRK
jgi:hypothetical protein